MWKLSFFSLVIVVGCSFSAYGQSDWAGAFPDIKGCAKTIGPFERTGSFATQTAIYEGCGTIELRIAPGAKAAREKNWQDHFPSLKTEIKGYTAWRNSPLCGNDPWLGSIEVYLSEDKVLIASAYDRADQVLNFAEQADYIALANVMQLRKQ